MFGGSVKLRDILRARREMKQWRKQQEAAGNLPTAKDLLFGRTGAVERLADPARQADMLAALAATSSNPQAALEAQRAAMEAATDPIAQLERLGALRANGTITDAEFEAAKAQVLSA